MRGRYYRQVDVQARCARTESKPRIVGFVVKGSYARADGPSACPPQERVASAPLACAPPDSLLYEWRQVCHEAGVPAPAQASWWRRLRKAYSSPTRYYHTLEHLHAMFKWLRPLRANVNSWVDVRLPPPASEYVISAGRGRAIGSRAPPLHLLAHSWLPSTQISFSVFFHDAVYEANAQRPGANERDSAALWRQFASECLTAGEGRDSTWHGTNASAPTMEGVMALYSIEQALHRSKLALFTCSCGRGEPAHPFGATCPA